MPDKNRKLIDEFKLLGENEAARARPFDTGYRKPAPKQTPMEKLAAILKQQGSFAAPRPHGTTVSQYEKDFRDYVANQQAARQQLMSDLVSPSRIANAVVPGAVGALTGYGSQILGGPGDLVGLYEEFKPESWASAPTPLQSLPSTEQVQELFAPKADSFIGRRMPEYEAGTTGGNLYALGEGVAALPSLARGVGRGAKALGKEAGRRIDDAMLTGEGLLGKALSPARPSFIKAYHGSPHRFAPTAKNPLGEFDPAKIGTGEGAQAYGYGHYLAEAPKTATEYARNLANRDMSNQGRLNAHANAQRLADLAGDPKYAADDIKFVLEQNPDYPQKQLLQETLAFLESGKFKNPLPNQGNLYKIDLPDEVVPRMLDYDKHLAEQSPYVQKILGDYQKELGTSFGRGDQVLKEIAFDRRIKGLDASPAAVSKQLNELGIPGIQYLDAGSRGANAGAGTRNFVVFPGNEGLLNILGRE